MQYKLLFVKWADAHGEGGMWQPLEFAEASRVFAYTVGWLTDETEDDINLVQTLAINEGDDSAFYNRIDIPKGMIVEMRELPGFEI